jgi:hypothetical protein
MRPEHNDHRRNRNGRVLVWPLIVLWLFSTLAQASNCCCGPEAPSGLHGRAAASVGSHADAHSHNHHAPHAADAGTVHAHDEGTGPDTDPACSELKRPDGSLQSNWAVYMAPTGSDQPGPVRVELGFGLPRAPALASPIRPPSVPPPSLNPFLSTVRLLL